MAPSKHIVLTLLGQDPQILTKTLYALLIEKRVPVAEIWMITTGDGKKTALNQLFNSGKGYLYRFFHDYEIDSTAINFGPDTIIDAKEIAQRFTTIGTAKKEMRFVDAFFNILKEKTDESDTTLHCTLAADGKIMNVYFAYALQFYGRSSDRLYHVFASPSEFESSRDFFYIPPSPEIVHNQAGKKMSTADARIKVEEINFVKLRSKIEYLFGSSGVSFQEMVKLSHKELEQMPGLPSLIVDRHSRSLFIGGKKILLTPIEFSIYRYYIERAQSRPKSIPTKEYDRYFEGADGYFFAQEGTKRLLEIYKEYVSSYALDEFRASLVKGALPFERVCQYYSRIKHKIKKALHNDANADYYFISPVGRYRKKYGLKLDKTKIIIH